MTLENDPIIKRPPSDRMRKQLAKLVARENLKIAAKAKILAEIDPTKIDRDLLEKAYREIQSKKSKDK